MNIALVSTLAWGAALVTITGGLLLAGLAVSALIGWLGKTDSELKIVDLQLSKDANGFVKLKTAIDGAKTALTEFKDIAKNKYNEDMRKYIENLQKEINAKYDYFQSHSVNGMLISGGVGSALSGGDASSGMNFSEYLKQQGVDGSGMPDFMSYPGMDTTGARSQRDSTMQAVHQTFISIDSTTGKFKQTNSRQPGADYQMLPHQTGGLGIKP